MEVTRRKALLVGAAAPIALAGCTATQIATATQNWSNFVDQVNQYLAAGCGALPGFVASVNTIEAVVGVLYPSAAAAVAAGAAAVQAVAGAICKTVPSSAPAVLSSKLRASASTGIAVFVGNLNLNGHVIPVTGYGLR